MSNFKSRTKTSTEAAPHRGAKPLVSELSPLQKAVKFGYLRGHFECDDFRHYTLVHTAGDEFPHASLKHWRDIIKMMRPYVDWTCSCQKNALMQGSLRNRSGALQTDWILPGAQCVGVGKLTPGEPAKMVYPIPNRLSQEQRKHLEQQYPERLFVVTHSSGHDHPISHVATKISAQAMINDFPRGTAEKPFRILDLYGNPGSNEQHNARESTRKIDTTCFAWTAKDFGRKFEHWGQPVVDGKRRYYDVDLRTLEGLDTPEGIDMADVPSLTSYDRLMAIHALYYFSPDEICRIVNAYNVPIVAIFHQFKGENGSLNAGELNYTKRYDEDRHVRMVDQLNVKGGVEYSHLDNSWIFEAQIWAHTASVFAEIPDSNGKATGAVSREAHKDSRCMSWDLCEMTDGTWKGTFYPIPATCYNMELANGKKVTTGNAAASKEGEVKQTRKKKSKAVKANKVIEVTFGNKPPVVYNVPAQAYTLFEEARVRISNTPRTPARFRDHNNWIKREIKGVMSKPGNTVVADDISDIVHGSFWCDLVDDMSATTADGLEKFAASIRSDKVFTSGDAGMITNTFDMVLEAVQIGLSAKSARDGAHKGLSLARAFFKVKL